MNTDRYLILSGHRNYFYNQKIFYITELERIGNLLDKIKRKKKNYKKKYLEIKENNDSTIARLQKDIQYFRDKVNLEFIYFILKAWIK